MTTAALEVEVQPEEVGFDAGRLARIDRHFARYVDGGRLPGWLVLVSRDGRIAHLSTYGLRDMEAGLPVELDSERVFEPLGMTDTAFWVGEDTVKDLAALRQLVYQALVDD